MPIEKLSNWQVERTGIKGLCVDVWLLRSDKLADMLNPFLTGKSNNGYLQFLIPTKKILKHSIDPTYLCWKCEPFKGTRTQNSNLILLLPFAQRKQNSNFYVQTQDEIEAIISSRVSFLVPVKPSDVEE